MKEGSLRCGTLLLTVLNLVSVNLVYKLAFSSHLFPSDFLSLVYVMSDKCIPKFQNGISFIQS